MRVTPWNGRTVALILLATNDHSPNEQPVLQPLGITWGGTRGLYDVNRTATHLLVLGVPSESTLSHVLGYAAGLSPSKIVHLRT